MMKTIIPATFLFAFSVLFFSCSKNNPNPSYGLSFDENGTHRVFADSAHVDTAYTSWPSSRGNSETIVIKVFSGAESYSITITDYDYPIAVQTYYDTTNYIFHNYEMEIYDDMGNGNHWMAGMFVPGYEAPGTKHFSVTITSIKDSVVSGTFSGDMALENDWTLANNKHITNGKFSLKINQKYN